MTDKKRIFTLYVAMVLVLASLAGLTYLVNTTLTKQKALEQRLDTYYQLTRRLYQNKGGEAWYED